MSSKFSTSNTKYKIGKSRLLSLYSKLVKNMNTMTVSFRDIPWRWLLIIGTGLSLLLLLLMTVVMVSKT